MRRDRGEYLGLQRKVNPSGDEYVYFGCGDDVPVFDIGDLRFGITICYDSAFPELGRKRNPFPIWPTALAVSLIRKSLAIPSAKLKCLFCTRH